MYSLYKSPWLSLGRGLLIGEESIVARNHYSFEKRQKELAKKKKKEEKRLRKLERNKIRTEGDAKDENAEEE